jgi:hypothetical protein
MNKTLFTTAIVSNLLSLLLIHSGLSGSSHGAGAFFMLVYLGIIWLIASVILIIVRFKNNKNLTDSLFNKMIITFCTPLPIIIYYYFFIMH